VNRGLDEVFPPTPEVWAELARHEMAGDHQFGKAVRFLEEGGTDRNLLAERLGIKVDYADWLLNHVSRRDPTPDSLRFQRRADRVGLGLVVV
jgi:hypothetical protein